MKLLPKKQVSAELASQRKREIDIGLELAEKVDALREAAATEEKKLFDFRSQSIANAQKEIDTKIAEKDALDLDIRRRKEELAELQKPLDAKWDEVNKAANKLAASENDLASRLQTFAAKDSQKDAELQDIERRKRKIAMAEEATNKHLLEAEQKLRHAHETQDNLVSQALLTLSTAKSKESSISIRELEVRRAEQEIDERWGLVEEKEKDLAERERALQDKYQALTQAQKHLGIIV